MINRTHLRRVLAPIAIIISALLMQGCFQILHFLNVNKDGTVDVQWRFVVSAAMRQTEKKQAARGGGGGPGGDNPASGMSKNIFDNKGQLKAELEKIATNVVVEDVNTDFDVIMKASFKAKKGARIPAGSKFASGLPIYPDYDAVKKRMVFNFPSDKKAEKKGKDGQKKPAENPQAKQLAAMMLSTGRYQIIIGGVKIKNVYLVTNKGDDKTRVRAIPMGNVTMINFPFLAAMAKYEDGGLRLVVDLE